MNFLKTFSKSHLELTCCLTSQACPTRCLLGLPQQDKCTELTDFFFSEQGYTHKNTMVIGVFKQQICEHKTAPMFVIFVGNLQM